MRSTETNDFPLLILFSIHCPLVKMRVNRDSRSPDSLVISCKIFHTGKSLSETLIFAATNPQYDNRLFIELQVQYITITSSNMGRTCCVQKLFMTFRTILYTTGSPHILQKEKTSVKDLHVFNRFYLKHGSGINLPLRPSRWFIFKIKF